MPPSERPLLMRMSVALSDGSFDTHVEMPTTAGKYERDTLVKAWLNLMQAALKVAAEKEGKPDAE